MRGSNAFCPGTLDSATSAGSVSKGKSLTLVTGEVQRGGQLLEEGEGVGSKLPGGVLCKQSAAPSMLCDVCMSSPSREGDEEAVVDDGDEEEEQCGGEVGRHWEPWLGMADWEL